MIPLSMLLGVQRPYSHLAQQVEAASRCAIDNAAHHRKLSITQMRDLVREALESGPGTTSEVASFCACTSKVAHRHLDAMRLKGDVVRHQRDGKRRAMYAWALAPDEACGPTGAEAKAP